MCLNVQGTRPDIISIRSDAGHPTGYRVKYLFRHRISSQSPTHYFYWINQNN